MTGEDEDEDVDDGEDVVVLVVFVCGRLMMAISRLLVGVKVASHQIVCTGYILVQAGIAQPKFQPFVRKTLLPHSSSLLILCLVGMR